MTVECHLQETKFSGLLPRAINTKISHSSAKLFGQQCCIVTGAMKGMKTWVAALKKKNRDRVGGLVGNAVAKKVHASWLPGHCFISDLLTVPQQIL
jgi:hypothetical protein